MFVFPHENTFDDSSPHPPANRRFCPFSQVSAQFRAENLCGPQEEAGKSVGVVYQVN